MNFTAVFTTAVNVAITMAIHATHSAVAEAEAEAEAGCSGGCSNEQLQPEAAAAIMASSCIWLLQGTAPEAGIGAKLALLPVYAAGQRRATAIVRALTVVFEPST